MFLKVTRPDLSHEKSTPEEQAAHPAYFFGADPNSLWARGVLDPG